MREETINPFYEPIISEAEYTILRSRKEDKTQYAIPQKRQEKYDEITPYTR